MNIKIKYNLTDRMKYILNDYDDTFKYNTSVIRLTPCTNNLYTFTCIEDINVFIDSLDRDDILLITGGFTSFKKYEEECKYNIQFLGGVSDVKDVLLTDIKNKPRIIYGITSLKHLKYIF